MGFGPVRSLHLLGFYRLHLVAFFTLCVVKCHMDVSLGVPSLPLPPAPLFNCVCVAGIPILLESQKRVPLIHTQLKNSPKNQNARETMPCLGVGTPIGTPSPRGLWIRHELCRKKDAVCGGDTGRIPTNPISGCRPPVSLLVSQDRCGNRRN